MIRELWPVSCEGKKGRETVRKRELLGATPGVFVRVANAGVRSGGEWKSVKRKELSQEGGWAEFRGQRESGGKRRLQFEWRLTVHSER